MLFNANLPSVNVRLKSAPLPIYLRGSETDTNQSMRILIIEDDKETACHIKRGLEESGHSADHADNGNDGYALARDESYDVLIVDRMLPGMEGLDVIKSLRDEKINTPALILSALGDVDDRVNGLRAGGDDYLTKPFAFAELLARVEAGSSFPHVKRVRTRLADTLRLQGKIIQARIRRVPLHRSRTIPRSNRFP